MNYLSIHRDVKSQPGLRDLIRLAPLLLLVAAGSVAACSPDARLEQVVRAVEREFPDVHHMPIDSAAAWVATGQPLLFDVREADEFAVSHLGGARHLAPGTEDLSPLDSLGRDSPILVYCAVGYRASDMARRLQARGFTNVHNLRGAIFQWANEERPLAVAPVVHPYSATWSRLLRPEKRAPNSGR